MASSDTAQVSFDRLDAMFRYILPGFVVVGVAYLAYPSWFKSWVDPTQSGTLVLLAGLSLTVAAVAYCLHRFTVHQLLDIVISFYIVCYLIMSGKGLRQWFKPYFMSVRKAIETGVPKSSLGAHITLRSSHLILLFVAIESAILFGVLLSPECKSIMATIMAGYRCWVVLFLFP